MSDFSDPRHLFGDQQLTMPDFLPLQSSMMPTVSAPSKTPEQASDLPTVPTGSLRDALLGKFDDPEIPSGLPSQEQQDQAFTHRLIGSGVGQAVDSLQNAANIFKPGAGNPHMGEASRQFGEMLAQRALGNAKERRDEALQNFQLKDATDQRHEKMYQMATALKQQRDMNDPNSDMSRQAQAQEGARLDTLIAAAQDPAMQQNLAKRKMSLVGASAAQLAAGAKEDPTEKLLGMASIERTASAKNAEDAKNHAEERRIGWANVANTKRGQDLTAQERADSLQAKKDKQAVDANVKIIGQQAPLVDQISKVLVTMKSLEDAGNMLQTRGGSVTTDWGKNKIEHAKQDVPGFVSAMLPEQMTPTPDPKYQEFWGLVQPTAIAQRLANEKTVRVSKAIMEQLSQYLPNEGDNNNTQAVDNKIKNSHAYLRDRTLPGLIAQLRVDPETGKAIDKSVLAQQLADKAGMDADEVMAALSPSTKHAPRKLNQKQVDFLKAKAASGDADAQKMLKDAGL